jgi:hypothetical protein
MKNYFRSFFMKKNLSNTAIGYGIIMGESCPTTDLDSPLRLQEVQAARISAQSALWPEYQGYLKEISLVFGQ